MKDSELLKFLDAGVDARVDGTKEGYFAAWEWLAEELHQRGTGNTLAWKAACGKLARSTQQNPFLMPVNVTVQFIPVINKMKGSGIGADASRYLAERDMHPGNFDYKTAADQLQAKTNSVWFAVRTHQFKSWVEEGFRSYLMLLYFSCPCPELLIHMVMDLSDRELRAEAKEYLQRTLDEMREQT